MDPVSVPFVSSSVGSVRTNRAEFLISQANIKYLSTVWFGGLLVDK